MRTGFARWITVAVVSLAPIPAAAQVAALPRAPDGKPDLQGIWQVFNTAAWDIQDHHARLGVPAGQGVVEGNEIPYQAWASTKKQENFDKRTNADPEVKGYLPGVPRIMYMPFPFQIFQTPRHVTMAFEYAHAVRIIYTNGSPHPAGPLNFWLGDSRGRWEGDTLVVDVVHFTDQTWFDRAGNSHGDLLHLIERYTLIGPDHMNYEVTIEDPMVFTRRSIAAKSRTCGCWSSSPHSWWRKTRDSGSRERNESHGSGSHRRRGGSRLVRVFHCHSARVCCEWSGRNRANDCRRLSDRARGISQMRPGQGENLQPSAYPGW